MSTIHATPATAPIPPGFSPRSVAPPVHEHAPLEIQVQTEDTVLNSGAVRHDA
jgi:hypothetical protein